jgi:hypothetical protein
MKMLLLHNSIKNTIFIYYGGYNIVKERQNCLSPPLCPTAPMEGF